MTLVPDTPRVLGNTRLHQPAERSASPTDEELFNGAIAGLTDFDMDNDLGPRISSNYNDTPELQEIEDDNDDGADGQRSPSLSSGNKRCRTHEDNDDCDDVEADGQHSTSQASSNKRLLTHADNNRNDNKPIHKAIKILKRHYRKNKIINKRIY
jgi:hypothetical protein